MNNRLNCLIDEDVSHNINFYVYRPGWLKSWQTLNMLNYSINKQVYNTASLSDFSKDI